MSKYIKCVNVCVCVNTYGKFWLGFLRNEVDFYSYDHGNQ